MEVENKSMKDAILKMMKEWQCEDNEVLLKLIDQYEQQYKLCQKLLNELNQDDTTFVDLKEDRYHGVGFTINPLLKEIPKITEAANKTALLILNTIQKIGIKPETKEEESSLSKFLNGDEEDGDGEEE